MESIRKKFAEGVISMKDYILLAVASTVKYLISNYKFEFVNELGKGAYGHVVELKPPGHPKVAAKIVIEELASDNEMELWPILCHENLLELIHFEHIETTFSYVFFTPRHPTTLSSLVRSADLAKDGNGMKRATAWINGICSGIDYLHKNNMVHLDLKMSNVLISEEDVAIITDFGSLTRRKGPTDRLVINFLRRYIREKKIS